MVLDRPIILLPRGISRPFLNTLMNDAGLAVLYKVTMIGRSCMLLKGIAYCGLNLTD